MLKKTGILGLTRSDLLALDPKEVTWIMTGAEIRYLAMVMEAFWQYDYKKAKLGCHVILKSGLHSNGFFAAKFILEHPNLCQILAGQICVAYLKGNRMKPDWAAGVPDSATNLAKDCAEIMGRRHAIMEKSDDDSMLLTTSIPEGETILVFEDVCSTGKGFGQAISAIRVKSPLAKILPFEPVILNRSGLAHLDFGDVGGGFTILSLLNERMDVWPSGSCSLCGAGSPAIAKPKKDRETWQKLVTSQD